MYTITIGANETFRLVKRVRRLDPGVDLKYGVDDSTLELTLSERLGEDEVAPTLARVLAESTAVLRGGGRRG